MITDVCKSNTLKVIKRDGKRASFNEDKIGLAIKKGFDSLGDKYTPDDSSLVYKKVIEDINKDYADSKTIKIEDIQDLIEHNLRELGYVDVLESYSSYRENRAKSRSMFINRQHKLIKAIEALSLKDASEEDSKRDNANVNGDTAMGTMLQYGSTISKEFSKSYFIKPVHSDLHDSGMIHIHDMDFLPMGTTTCCQIDLANLFEKGFSTGHGYLRTPNSIMSYAALAAIVIQSNQNDQHGGQSIPAFDYYMAPGVVKSFKKSFKSHLFDYLELMGFDKFLNLNGIEKEISKIKEVNFSMNRFEKFFKESGDVELLFRKAHKKAIIDVEKQTYQAMESFIHNLNTMHSRAGAQVPFSSINFGTDTSFEGRMVIKNYLLATEAGLGNSETPIFPISIFKVKEGVNYNEGDPNYDLFKLACKVSAKRLFPNFSFIDSPFNKQYYKEGNINTEIAYMGCRTRVIANAADPDREIVTGRGNLSFTSINLVRLGIKYGIVDGTRKKADMEGFYKELADTMDMVRDQLLDRFEIQCKRHVYNFPFLLGQGIWIDSKGLKNKDGLRKVLKHGTLTEGFIGLAECLKALTGKHHGESKSSQELGLEIIKFMRNRCDEYAQEYKLNFSLIATPAEGLSGRFTAIDKSIYGIIPGVTDREYYTNSFHVPVYYNTSIANKIKLEAPYHALTNGGHISYIELDGDLTENVDAFIKVVRMMKEAGIGYGAINHPVDRDPVCGFTGVIGDVCPGCGRSEADGVKFERIRRITGYLVGTVDRFNNGKKAEEHDRVKHTFN
ncbi:MAG: anaerobic ribonucleoside triphosphate reductase [Bacilli bacterium]|nr:anaerobic ribonucleoside triphosphate reductase [Bacilli bacterium]